MRFNNRSEICHYANCGAATPALPYSAHYVLSLLCLNLAPPRQALRGKGGTVVRRAPSASLKYFRPGFPYPQIHPQAKAYQHQSRQNDYSQNKCPLPYLMSALPPIDVRSSSGSRLSPSRIGTSAKGHQATCCGSSCRGGRRLDREIARLLANAQTRVPVEEPTARLC
jgi:hypothetical protein